MGGLILPHGGGNPHNIGNADAGGRRLDRHVHTGFPSELCAELKGNFSTDPLMPVGGFGTQDEFSIFGQFIIIRGLLILGELGPPLS